MKKLKIIIADDIFTNRLLLTEIIEDMGHDCIAVKNGKEVIDVLIKENIDLILMDIEMPVMNGLEATKYIREKLDISKKHIPVIALTAHNPKIFFDDYKDVGFNKLLTKPYSVGRVTDILNEYVKK